MINLKLSLIQKIENVREQKRNASGERRVVYDAKTQNV